MAQLLIRHNDGAQRKAGDVVVALNDLRIRCTHAQHICNRKNFGFNSDGLRPISLFHTLEQRTAQYRFERVSKTEIIRIDGDKVELFGPSHIAVQLYIDRRIGHPMHKIFGRTGREFWYGGSTEVSHAAYDDVWGRIHDETNYREEFHKTWSMGRLEKINHSLVEVDDFENPEDWQGQNVMEMAWPQLLKA